MKRITLIPAIIAIFAAGLLFGTGCNPDQDSSSPKEEPIRIGAIVPLTGDLSFFGEGDRRALRLYAEQHPEVTFIFEDSEASPKEGLSAARKLSAQGINYYITSLSYVVNTVQPVLDKEEALNFTLNMDPSSEENSKYVLRLYVSFHNEMDKLISLAQERGVERVAVLYANVETMNRAVEEYLRPRLEEAGIQLRTETFEVGNKNFRQQLLKLAGDSGQRPGLLRILDFGNNLGTILRGAQESGLYENTTYISGIETLLSDYKQFPPEITDKFMFTAPKLLLREDNEIVQKYTDRYGSPPSFDAMFAYDIASLLVPKIKEHGYENVDAVIESITSMEEYTGVAARYYIENDGGISPRIHWATIENGNIEFSNLELVQVEQ